MKYTNIEDCERVARLTESYAVHRILPPDELADAIGIIDGWAGYRSRRKGSITLRYPASGIGGEEWALRRAMWIESRMWFHSTQDLLVHVFTQAKPMRSYQLLKLNESFEDSLLRHNLDERWNSKRPPCDARSYILGRFVIEVRNQWLANPLPKFQYAQHELDDDARREVEETFIEEAERLRRERQEAYDREREGR